MRNLEDRFIFEDYFPLVYVTFCFDRRALSCRKIRPIKVIGLLYTFGEFTGIRYSSHVCRQYCSSGLLCNHSTSLTMGTVRRMIDRGCPRLVTCQI